MEEQLSAQTGGSHAPHQTRQGGECQPPGRPPQQLPPTHWYPLTSLVSTYCTYLPTVIRPPDCMSSRLIVKQLLYLHVASTLTLKVHVASTLTPNVHVASILTPMVQDSFVQVACISLFLLFPVPPHEAAALHGGR